MILRRFVLLALGLGVLAGCATTGGSPGGPRMNVSGDATYPPTVDVAIFCQTEMVLNGVGAIQTSPPYWPYQAHEVFSTIAMEWTETERLGLALSGTASGAIGGGAMFPELRNVIPRAEEGKLDKMLQDNILPMARERGADAVAITRARYKTKYRGYDAVSEMSMEWCLIKYRR